MNNAPLDSQGLPPGTSLRADEIAPRDFAARLNADPKRVVLIDVRTAAEWATAHVQGSTHVPLEQIESRAPDLDLEDATLIGILCHHGVRSLKATLALREMGHKDTFSIIGGIELWSKAVDPGIPRYERDRATGRCTTLPNS